MSQLFGFQINRKAGQRGQSPVPPAADEPIAVAAGGYYGTYVDTDNQARNEAVTDKNKKVQKKIQKT